jgi:hypothetical protein
MANAAALRPLRIPPSRAIGSRLHASLYRRNATHGAVRGLPDSWHLKSVCQLKESQSASRSAFGMCGSLRATQVAQGSRPAFISSIIVAPRRYLVGPLALYSAIFHALDLFRIVDKQKHLAKRPSASPNDIHPRFLIGCSASSFAAYPLGKPTMSSTISSVSWALSAANPE